MRSPGERTNRDIGENGDQPIDHAYACWDELRILNAQTAVRIVPSPRHGAFANGNDRRKIASGER